MSISIDDRPTGRDTEITSVAQALATWASHYGQFSAVESRQRQAADIAFTGRCCLEDGDLAAATEWQHASAKASRTSRLSLGIPS
jgi:hypothetical protein